MKENTMRNAVATVTRRTFISIGATAIAFAGVGSAHGEVSRDESNGGDSLPSWNAGPARTAILDFIRDTTDKAGSKYVEPAERIATFDQDGTLWTEHPLYGQAAFALARVGEMAAAHPEWKTTEPFKTVLARDYAAMSKFTEGEWMEIVAVTHSGMSTEAFQSLVEEWLAKAKAPRFDRPYTDLVYQPMLEAMQYLRANGYKTFIVSGGGQEFIRVYSEKVYGVPPEQVVGSSIVTTYVNTSGKPALMREPKPFFIDDGPGKPIAINLFIGRRPRAAFGNPVVRICTRAMPRCSSGHRQGMEPVS